MGGCGQWEEGAAWAGRGGAWGLQGRTQPCTGHAKPCPLAPVLTLGKPLYQMAQQGRPRREPLAGSPAQMPRAQAAQGSCCPLSQGADPQHLALPALLQACIPPPETLLLPQAAHVACEPSMAWTCPVPLDTGLAGQTKLLKPGTFPPASLRRAELSQSIMETSSLSTSHLSAWSAVSLPRPEGQDPTLPQISLSPQGRVQWLCQSLGASQEATGHTLAYYVRPWSQHPGLLHTRKSPRETGQQRTGHSCPRYPDLPGRELFWGRAGQAAVRRQRPREPPQAHWPPEEGHVTENACLPARAWLGLCHPAYACTQGL